MEEYDEIKAIAYIRQHAEAATRDYDDDEILNVVDMIFDYYEMNGMLDVDDDSDEEEIDVDDLAQYVSRMIAKDKQSPVRKEDIRPIVEAEIAYEMTLV